MDALIVKKLFSTSLKGTIMLGLQNNFKAKKNDGSGSKQKASKDTDTCLV